VNRVGAADAYAAYSSQFVRTSQQHVEKRAELEEKTAGRLRRNAGGCRERAFRRRPVGVALGPLGVVGPIDASSISPPANGDPRDPGGGIGRVVGMNHGDAEFVDGDQEAAHSFRRQRAVVQGLALDEQVPPRCRAAQPPDLLPQPTLDEREVKTAHRLPFDQGEVVDRVVAGPEVLDLDVVAEVAKRLRNATRSLMDVHDDVHEPRMPRRVVRRCNASAPKMSTSDFAGSWK